VQLLASSGRQSVAGAGIGYLGFELMPVQTFLPDLRPLAVDQVPGMEVQCDYLLQALDQYMRLWETPLKQVEAVAVAAMAVTKGRCLVQY
jgi:hypothetical protein